MVGRCGEDGGWCEEAGACVMPGMREDGTAVEDWVVCVWWGGAGSGEWGGGWRGALYWVGGGWIGWWSGRLRSIGRRMIGSDCGLGHALELVGRCAVYALGFGLKRGVRWGNGRLYLEVELRLG